MHRMILIKVSHFTSDQEPSDGFTGSGSSYNVSNDDINLYFRSIIYISVESTSIL